jgi:hypothetical protein
LYDRFFLIGLMDINVGEVSDLFVARCHGGSSLISKDPYSGRNSAFVSSVTELPRKAELRWIPSHVSLPPKGKHLSR